MNLINPPDTKLLCLNIIIAITLAQNCSTNLNENETVIVFYLKTFFSLQMILRTSKVSHVGYVSSKQENLSQTHRDVSLMLVGYLFHNFWEKYLLFWFFTPWLAIIAKTHFPLHKFTNFVRFKSNIFVDMHFQQNCKDNNTI